MSKQQRSHSLSPKGGSRTGKGKNKRSRSPMPPSQEKDCKDSKTFPPSTDIPTSYKPDSTLGDVLMSQYRKSLKLQSQGSAFSRVIHAIELEQNGLVVQLFVNPRYGPSPCAEQLCYLGPFPGQLLAHFQPGEDHDDQDDQDDQAKKKLEKILMSLCYQQVHLRAVESNWWWFDKMSNPWDNQDVATQKGKENFILLNQFFQSWKHRLVVLTFEYF